MGFTPDHIARHKHVEIRLILDAAGNLARLIARTGEKIAARRPDNCRSCVLRYHQAGKRLAAKAQSVGALT